MGDALKKYASAGIETDHECVTLEEARQRAALGMKVIIREGSAAKNFEALWPLINEAPEACMLCSDDKHPDDLVVDHLDALLRRLVAKGVDALTALRAASLTPVRHYGLNVGLLRNGDPADFVELADLASFRVRRTFIDGMPVATEGRTLLPRLTCGTPNVFKASPKRPEDFRLPAKPGKRARAIIAIDGQLLTDVELVTPEVQNGFVAPAPAENLLLMTVVNRYADVPPAIGLIRNFGLRRGAMASSVAHDSHNVVAVGASEDELCRAVNAVIAARGGMSFVSGQTEDVVPLPIAGLMSDKDAWTVARDFTRLTDLARGEGCELRSPYMTLSFMALLVIPRLKLGDKGLFDAQPFTLVDLWEA